MGPASEGVEMWPDRGKGALRRAMGALAVVGVAGLLSAGSGFAAPSVTETVIGLGGSQARAYAINGAGQVVGDGTIAGDSETHAFSWTRSGGRLTKDQAFAYADLIINHAHDQGLAIAQKNAAGQTALGKAAGFDFAVAEECGRYNECGAYISAYGSQVYVIEYRDADFTTSCDKWGAELSIVRRDRGVKGPGSSTYVYGAC